METEDRPFLTVNKLVFKSKLWVFKTFLFGQNTKINHHIKIEIPNSKVHKTSQYDIDKQLSNEVSSVFTVTIDQNSPQFLNFVIDST